MKCHTGRALCVDGVERTKVMLWPSRVKWVMCNRKRWWQWRGWQWRQELARKDNWAHMQWRLESMLNMGGMALEEKVKLTGRR